MKRFTLAVAAAVLVTTAGCLVAVEEPGKRVVVEETHVCFDACDHLFVDGGWYIVAGHRHGPNCGHYLVKGKWVKTKGDDKDQGPKDRDKDDKKDKRDKD